MFSCSIQFEIVCFKKSYIGHLYSAHSQGICD